MSQRQQSVSFRRRLKLKRFYWRLLKSALFLSPLLLHLGSWGCWTLSQKSLGEEEVEHGHVAISSQDRESNNYPHSHLQPIKSWQCTYMFLDSRNPTRGKPGKSTQKGKVQELLPQPWGDSFIHWITIEWRAINYFHLSHASSWNWSFWSCWLAFEAKTYNATIKW